MGTHYQGPRNSPTYTKKNLQEDVDCLKVVGKFILGVLVGPLSIHTESERKATEKFHSKIRELSNKRNL